MLDKFHLKVPSIVELLNFYVLDNRTELHTEGGALFLAQVSQGFFHSCLPASSSLFKENMLKISHYQPLIMFKKFLLEGLSD